MKFITAALTASIASALTVLEQEVDPNCTISLTDGSTLTVYYDTAADHIIMDARILDGSFAGFGWGASMQDTEMVIFSANGDSSALETYYGIGTVKPMEDDAMAACYETKITKGDDGYINFLTTRGLDCDATDYSGGSYVVALDTELSLISSWNPKNPQLSYHGKNKIEFKQTLGSDGKCAGVGIAPEQPADGIFSDDVTQWIQNQFSNLFQ